MSMWKLLEEKRTYMFYSTPIKIRIKYMHHWEKVIRLNMPIGPRKLSTLSISCIFPKKDPTKEGWVYNQAKLIKPAVLVS